jgi:hypothetical protein
MSIRSKALKWYKAKYGKLNTPIFSSKFYQPDESWPKKSVWWPQIPIWVIKEYAFINILCEVAPGKNEFYHLKVPTQFIRENLVAFHVIKEKIVDFYLSTDPKKIFVEERGRGNLNFKAFLVNGFD